MRTIDLDESGYSGSNDLDPPKQVRARVANRLSDAGADPHVVSSQLEHPPEVPLRHDRKAKAKRVSEILEVAGLGSRPDAGNVASLEDHRQKTEAT